MRTVVGACQFSTSEWKRTLFVRVMGKRSSPCHPVCLMIPHPTVCLLLQENGFFGLFVIKRMLMMIDDRQRKAVAARSLLRESSLLCYTCTYLSSFSPSLIFFSKELRDERIMILWIRKNCSTSSTLKLERRRPPNCEEFNV